jgi:dihydrofolate reductase
VNVSLIAAMDHNRVIGKDGTMPWHLPADLQWFKEKTKGHPVIMGRKTWESIGKALAGRTNIVITRQLGYSAPGCLIANDAAEALSLAGGSGETMIIGGARVYAACLSMAQKLYITVVHEDFEGDTWFPSFSLNDWLVDSVRHRKSDDKNAHRTSYYTLVRRKITIDDHPVGDGIPVEMRVTNSRATEVTR